MNSAPDDHPTSSVDPRDGVVVLDHDADDDRPPTRAGRLRTACAEPGAHAVLLVVEDGREWNDDAVLAVADASLPVVALLRGHVTGWAAGVALAADLRVAATDTVLRIDPLVGATSVTLPRMVTGAVARQLLLDPVELDADTAAGLGLVHDIAPPDEAFGAALALATRVAWVPGRGTAVLRSLVVRGDTVASALTEESRLRGVVDLHRRR